MKFGPNTSPHWWSANTDTPGMMYCVGNVSAVLLLSVRQDLKNNVFCIRKTCPCNVYPFEPHFYIVKLEYAGVYLFFLFLLQNIDCGYSLEPPRRGGSNLYPQSMFWAKIKKKYQTFSAKKFQFLKLKNSLYIAWACFRNGVEESEGMPS